MKKYIICFLALVSSGHVFAACPTTSLTFKDAAGTTQTLCFGGTAGSFIPQYQILDSGGANVLGVNASGQVTISNSAFAATQSGNWTARVVGNGGASMDILQGGATAATNALQIGAVFNTSLPTLTTGQAGALQADSNARLLISPSTLTIGQASTTSGQSGSLVFGAVTTGAPSYTTAQSDPLSLDTTGNLRVIDSLIGGCAGQTVANTLTKPINSAGASTALTLVAGVSAKKVYVCSIDIGTAAANNIALVEGTTTTTACDTGTAGVAGGATAATGWNFAANQGETKGNGTGIVFKTATAANALCLLFSAATQVSGSITYAQF